MSSAAIRVPQFVCLSAPPDPFRSSLPSHAQQYPFSLCPLDWDEISLASPSGLLPASPPSTGIIPSSKSHDPPTIPLHTLASPSQPRDEHSTALLDEKREAGRRSSDSAGSDFSLWSDTGDLAEQLADEEDPLRINLRGSVDEDNSRQRPHEPRRKQVRYAPHNHLEHKTTNPGVNKEAIEIPNPPPRQVGRAEKILAVVMTGKNGPRGLTGKPLLYVVTTVYAEECADRLKVFYERVRFIRGVSIWL